METNLQGMTKDEIIKAIAEKIDYLPEEMKEPMIYTAFYQMLQ